MLKFMWCVSIHQIVKLYLQRTNLILKGFLLSHNIRTTYMYSNLYNKKTNVQKTFPIYAFYMIVLRIHNKTRAKQNRKFHTHSKLLWTRPGNRTSASALFIDTYTLFCCCIRTLSLKGMQWNRLLYIYI